MGAISNDQIHISFMYLVFFMVSGSQNSGKHIFTNLLQDMIKGIPGWLSGLAPAFGPGCDPEDLGSPLSYLVINW